MSVDLRWLPPHPEFYPKPATCRFLNAESFLSVALQAYLAASNELVPPKGQKWVCEGNTWTTAEGFYESLMREVDDRLRLRAMESKDLFERAYQAEAMAHGCAASSPAVGPAPEAGQGRADTRPADPLFLDRERQELPEVAASGTTNTAIGAA